MSKEKYQQALNTLFMMSSEHLGFELNYEKNLLQELIDIYPEYLELKTKATPMKPYKQFMTSCLEGTGSWRTAIYATSCRRCHYTFDEIGQVEYCPHCGQKIDWAKNEQTNSSD